MPQLRALLWEKWDPLGLRGLAPDDEYDAYVKVLGSKLKRGNSKHDIAHYLASTLTDEASVPADWNARCERTAQDLLDWYGRSSAPR
jgi:hypothetical protein